MKEPNIHDELKNIAPGLSQLKPTEGYSVPPVYFKELQDKVLGQIQREQQQAPAPGWLSDLLQQYFRPRYAFAMATVAIIIVAAIIFRGGDDATLLGSISSEDAFEYVYNHITEYETLDLYTLVDVEDTDYLLDGDFSDEELNSAIDVLLEEFDTESLEELF